MLNNAVYGKQIPFKTVLFDTWYSTHKIMQHVDSLGKIHYASIKSNRNLTRVDSKYKYQAVSSLEFSNDELKNGIEVHLNNFAKGKHVQLFKITVSTNRIDYIVSFDFT